MEGNNSLELQLIENIMFIGNGNPGAITVLGTIKRDYPEKLMNIIYKLKSNQIRGHNVWLIYKKKCGLDIQTFLEYPFETYVNIE